jgi:hypothetical protein
MIILQQRPYNLQFDVLSLAKLEVEKKLLVKPLKKKGLPPPDHIKHIKGKLHCSFSSLLPISLLDHSSGIFCNLFCSQMNSHG